MSTWRILLVNAVLTERTGTETALRDLALGLRAAGHQPMVYAPRLGAIAQELSAAGIPVASDLRLVPAVPDIVHGNHHAETLEALFHFPVARGLFVCHDRTFYLSAPPRLARIRRYVAVDFNCLERLVDDYRIPRDLTRVIFNAVDMDRFPQRAPLPPAPARTAVFSNYAGPGTHLEAVQVACAQLNLPLDVIGANAGTSSAAPEQILGQYDLVFAKARCALEAMAAGAAVVLCDTHGVGSMVTLEEMPDLRPWNFGRRLLKNRPTAAAIVAQVRRYDASDARAVSTYIRAHAGLADAVSQYVRVYDELMEEPAPVPVPAARELDEYVRAFATRVHDLESELVELRRPYRMEPLSIETARQVSIAVQRAPEEVDAGVAFQVAVDVQNDSGQTLGSFPPYPLHLSYRWLAPDSDTPFPLEGVRTALRPTLLPGSRGAYAMHIIAPKDPGRYRLRLTLVQESVMWLDTLPQARAARADVVLTVRGTPSGAGDSVFSDPVLA